MAEQAVVEAVEARLREIWDETGRCPIIGANDQGNTPSEGQPFLLVQYPVSNTVRTTHSPSYREEGGFRIMINTERATGIQTPMQWGHELAAAFRYKKFGGVETQAPTTPLIHDDNEDGNYYRTSVVVPYSYTFFDPEP